MDETSEGKREARKEARRARREARRAAPAFGAPVDPAIQVPQLLGRVREHAEAGQPAEALALCRQVLELDPGRPDLLAFAGTLAFELNDHAEAASLYREALAARPDFAEVHYNLGNALRELGEPDDAIAAYRRAVEIDAGFAAAHNNMGSVLQTLGRHEEAIAAHGRALEIVPEAAEGHRNLGVALQKVGRLDEAVTAFRTALELRPERHVVYNSLALALMEKGDGAAAREVCEAWSAASGGDVEAIAFLTVALNEVGDREALAHYLDFERFVQARHLAAPAPYADQAEFNAALVAHVRAHPTLSVPDPEHPTFHHPDLMITGELLAEPKGPMAELEAMMRQAAGDYLRDHPADAGHAFLRHPPRDYRLTSWSAVLRGQGYLLPHIHMEGYLSGVYYAQIPDDIAETDPGHAGWFELGRAPADLHPSVEPEVFAIRPEEGLMVLFPSYMYHRTVPFRSEGWRISIAFDVVPVAPANGDH
jgi:uncharacterized protein (TIGR02466 family)